MCICWSTHTQINSISFSAQWKRLFKLCSKSEGMGWAVCCQSDLGFWVISSSAHMNKMAFSQYYIVCAGGVVSVAVITKRRKSHPLEQLVSQRLLLPGGVSLGAIMLKQWQRWLHARYQEIMAFPGGDTYSAPSFVSHLVWLITGSCSVRLLSAHTRAEEPHQTHLLLSASLMLESTWKEDERQLRSR